MNHSFRQALRRLVPALLVLLAPATTPAQSTALPSTMSFQGYLTDQNGSPLGATNVGPKNYTVKFRIWDIASGTTAADELYAEQQIVTVNNGYFSVLLGQGAAADNLPNPKTISQIFSGANTASRYVEMVVVGIGANNTDVTLAPRLQLVASPYAYLANNAGYATTAGSLITGTTPEVSVANNGYVGINTTSPGQALEVNGNGQVDGYLTFNQGFGDKLILYPDNVSAPASANSYGLGIQSKVLQIHSDSSSSDILFGYGSSTNFTETMRIKGNGSLILTGSANVGSLTNNGAASVGTSLSVGGAATLKSSLSVSGTTTLGTTTVGSLTASNIVNLYSDAYVWGSFTAGEIVNLYSDAYVYGSFEADGTANFFGSGIFHSRVGIGTTSPGYPLEVSGNSGKYFDNGSTITQNNSSTGFQLGNPDAYTANGDFASNFRGTYPIGIFVNDGGVAAQAFVATSDARIKNIVARPAGSNILAQVMQLRVTDYRMKDRLANGPQLHRGVIAQEVNQVFPQAVQTATNYIPDIYAYALSVSNNASHTLVSIHLSHAHQLAVNDWVKVFMGDQELKVQVVAVPDAKSFVIPSGLTTTNAFVYGRRVNDLMTVDYNQLFATGLGAIQELVKRTDALQARDAELAGLKQQVALVTARDAALEARLAAQQTQLADLKKMVVQLAEVAKNSKLTARAGENNGSATTTAIVAR